MSEHLARPERIASRVLAFLPTSRADPPSVTEILSLAEDTLDVLEWAVAPVERGAPDVWRASLTLMWSRECEVEEPDKGASEYVIWLQRKLSRELWHHDSDDLSPEARQEAQDARWVLGVGVQLGKDPLFEYHRLVQVLYTLVPDAPACLDMSACQMRSSAWLSAVAKYKEPPHPRCLFSIHSAQNGRDSQKRVWLHTHGLARCGAVEYELLNVPPGLTKQGKELLEVIAVGAIENGSGAPGVPFSPGEDIVLEWRPWPDAARMFPRLIGSRLSDRDEVHQHPSGVLLEKTPGVLFPRYALPMATLRRINEKTVYYISDMEAERMRLVAHNRFGMFKMAFRLFSQREDWRFLVKCAFPVNVDDDHDSREHLWFICADLEKDRFLGYLMNTPLAIDDLTPGARDWVDLSRMTDWKILIFHDHPEPENTLCYHPENIFSFNWNPPA